MSERKTYGWDCGCLRDGKHTGCPEHAASDVYSITTAPKPPQERICFHGCAEAINTHPDGPRSVYIVCGPNCKRAPAPVSPDTDKGTTEARNLILAAVERHAPVLDGQGRHVSLEQMLDNFAAALNAQHLAALEGVRKEEREKAKELAEMANHLYHCRDCGDLSPMSCDTWANHPTWEQTYRATLEAE